MNDAPSPIRICLAVPSDRTWMADTSIRFGALCAHLAGRGYHLDMINPKGSDIVHLRNTSVEEAIGFQSDWLLMIDSDMTFPKELFHELARHNKPIMGVNASTRYNPPVPTAWDMDCKPIFAPSFGGPEGLIRCKFIGTGALLCNMKVFQKLDFPWFMRPWDEKHRQHLGEDYYFSAHCARSGLPIFVDNSFSISIGHVGDFIYSLDMCDPELHGPIVMNMNKETTLAPSEDQA